MDAVQPELCDKPVGQDALLQRPNVVAERGVQGALARLDDLVEQAVASVPDCEGAQEMRDLVRMTAMRLAPKKLARSAA
jgi:geranylgeranyl diphosphate synthase type II